MDQFERRDINDKEANGPTVNPAEISVQSEAVKSGDRSDPLYSGKRTAEDEFDGYWLGIDPLDKLLKFAIGGKLTRFLYKLGTFRFDLFKDSQAGNAIYINDEREGNLPSVDIRRKNGTGGAMYLESDSGAALQVRQTNDTASAIFRGDKIQAGNGGVVEAIAEADASAPAVLARNLGTGQATYGTVENAASDAAVAARQSNAVESSHFWRMEQDLGYAVGKLQAGRLWWLGDGANPNGALSGYFGDLCISGGTIWCNAGGMVWTAIAPTPFIWGTDIDSSQSADLIGFLAQIQAGEAANTTGQYVQKVNAWTTWALAIDYVADDRVKDSGGVPYKCILDNTSAAGDEPGVGANWATYWVAEAIPTQNNSFGFQADMGDDGNAAGFHAFGKGDASPSAKGKHFIGWERSADTDKKVVSVGNGAYDGNDSEKGFRERAWIRSDGAVCFGNGDPADEHYVGLKAPTNDGDDTVYELPEADGAAGQVLKTDGAGKLAWGWEKKIVAIKVFSDTQDVATGDGKVIFIVPAELNGWLLTAVASGISTVSSSGLPTVQLRNVTDSQDMLSTKLSIDANEYTSYTAATPAVIDTGHDDVATGDRIAVDVDVAGTGAKGLQVMMTFETA
jgi:hypothetical protein